MAAGHAAMQSNSQIAKLKAAYIVKTARSVTLTNVLAPLFALALFHDDADPQKLALWLAYMFVATCIRTLGTSSLQVSEENIHNPEHDLKIVTIGVGLIGIGWGLGWVLLVPDLNEMNRMIYLYVTAGGMFNSMFGYCVHWPTFYSYIVPTMVPAISTVLWNRDIFPWPFAVGLSILFICVVKIAKNFSKTFEESVRLRLRNEKLYQELAIERDQSIAANVAKSNFVASASHDLRQPMYAVNMYLDTLDLDADIDKAKQTVQKIKSSVLTLNEMFEALLNISKLDSFSYKPDNHHFSVTRFANALKEVVLPHAIQKNLELKFQVKAKQAFGDDALLSQIVLNLINNAVQYTDEGEVVVTFYEVNQCLHIAVDDTGCGLTPEDQSHIFEEFYRVEKTRSKHDGLGLGLPIVSRLCRLIGAEIGINSKLGRGTSFNVATVYPASADAEMPDLNLSRPQHAESVRGKNIAVIEDDVIVLEAYKQALITRGANVIQIALGDKEFENQMALLSERTIDFIISDFRLQDATGADMIAKVRNAYNDEIPALIVTADTSPSHIQNFAELNIPVLHKPVSFQQVIAVIEAKLMERARGQGAISA
jgi:signal transduction histidine kinase/CheY-like chemotaxis protein